MIKSKYGNKQVSLKDSFNDILHDRLPVTGDDGDDVVLNRFLESKDCERLLDDLVDAVRKHLDTVVED